MRDAARARHPDEACGLLWGPVSGPVSVHVSGPVSGPVSGDADMSGEDRAHISRFEEAANVHPTPRTHFEIDPQALINAHRAQRDGAAAVEAGGQTGAASGALVGYFHSHPTGSARPSACDAQLAAGDGKIWAIAAGEDVTFWRDEAEGFCALSFVIVDP